MFTIRNTRVLPRKLTIVLKQECIGQAITGVFLSLKSVCQRNPLTDVLRLIVSTQTVGYPDSWAAKTHRLFFCRRVNPPPNKCPAYDNKQCNGEAPVMQKLWRMRSTPLLPSL